MHGLSATTPAGRVAGDTDPLPQGNGLSKQRPRLNVHNLPAVPNIEIGTWDICGDVWDIYIYIYISLYQYSDVCRYMIYVDI